MVIRHVFNLATNRLLLINWARQITTDLAIISLAYLVYVQIIVTKQNLIPDFSTFAEELWIVIVIFIYQVLNKVQLSTSASINRKNNYIHKRFLKFKSKYHSVLTKQVHNEKLIVVIYSIMIYEDFNRPKVIRLIENIFQKLGSKPRSLGIMQVTTDKSINDLQSVELAIKKITEHYYQIPEIIKTNRKKNKYFSSEKLDSAPLDWEVKREILKNYNPDDDYIEEVSDLIDIISKEFNSEDLEYTFEKNKEA